MAHKRAWLKGIGIAAAVLVGLLLLGVALAEPISERLIERARADLAAQLNRPVLLGDVEVTPLRGRLRLERVQIGAREGESDSAALTVETVEVDIGVWRTFGSLARRVHVQNVEVRRPTVSVLRRADGTLNWDEISEQWQRDPTGERRGAPRRFHIQRGTVSEGEIRFLQSGPADERQDTAPVSISQLNISVAELATDRGGRLALRAAVLAPEPNLRLEMQLKELERLPLIAAIYKLRLQLSPTALSPLAPYLSALLGPEYTPEQARIAADVQFIETTRDGSTGTGQLTVEGARFHEGRPFDARLQFELLTDREAKQLVFNRVTLEVADMQIDARATLSGLASAAPQLGGLELRSRKLDFDRIRAHYPGFEALSAPVKLRGPFAIQASGVGSEPSQRLKLELKLSQASVILNEALEKPPGTPAELRAQLRREGDKLVLERGTLRLSSFELAGNGHVERRNGRPTRYALRLDTTHAALGGLLRLLPPVASAFPETAPPEGELQISAESQGTLEEWRARANVHLSGVEARAEGAILEGAGSLRFDVKQLEERLTGQLSLDLSELEAVYLDVIRKPSGTPLQLDVTIREAGKHSRADFTARVASLSAEGHAVLRPTAGSQAFTAEVALGAWRARPLLALLPEVGGAGVPDVRFEPMLISAAGVIGRPATLELELEEFTARSGKSDLRGSLRLANPRDPQIAFDGRSSSLDLDDFLPDSERNEAEPSPLAEADGQLALAVERGLAAGVPYRNLRARLKLKNGRAVAETLEVDAFGGHFSGAGSELPLFVDDGPYHLEGSVKAVELGPVLARFAGTDQLMTGNLESSFELTFALPSPKALSQSLTGHLMGRVNEAEFLPGSVMSTLAEQLSAAEAFAQLDRKRVGSWQLGELSGTLVFDQGAVVIDEPLKAETPYGPLSLRGKLGLGGPADLIGTIGLHPDALQELVGLNWSLDGPVPLEFRMSGSLERPEFTITNLERALAPLLRASLKKSVGSETERALRQAVRGLLDPDTPPKRDEPKRDEPKRDEPKRDEPKRDEPKRDEPKRDEPLEKELKRRLKDLF